MNKSDVENKLQVIHHDHGHDDILIMDKSLDDQGYDSLDKVEMVMQVEKEFGVSVDDNIMSQISTPNDVVELIVGAHGE
jgi:acyl carrier protein